MRIINIVWIVAAFVAGVENTARAQLIEGPPGAQGGIFGGGPRAINPDRTSQTFDASIDLSGGYEHDPNLFGFDPGIDLSDETRWYASTVSTAARYRVGSVRRSFGARGRGIFNYQSNAADWLVGGEAGVNAAVQFGRGQHQLTGGINAANEPGWVFGSFGTGLVPSTDGSDIGVAPPPGILEQRWMVLDGSVAYEHHWNAHNMTMAEYENRRLRPLEGAGLDSDTQYGSVEHSWTSTPNITLLAAYRIDQSEQSVDLVGSTEPVEYQTIEGGARFERRLSPSRRFAFSFRGGATHLLESSSTQGLETLHPTVTVGTEMTLSRTWNLSVEVGRRTVTLLAGVNALPVMNDGIDLTINATPSRRLRFVLLGSFARAKSFSSDGVGGSVTEVAGGTSELRYAVSPWAAVFASYGFYHHRFQDESLAVTGFPTRYDRHSARVGMSLWVPLYGAF